VFVTKPSNRREEPQLVLFDRATNRHVAVVGAIRLVHELEAARLQFGREIVAGETPARIVHAEQSGESVPSIFRDQIRLRAAVLEFGGLAAELNAYFGCRGRIEIKATSVPFAVELHPVEEGAVVRVMPAV